MFETIRQKYLSHWKNVKWVQEVNIGVGGNIDYVAIEVDEYDRVVDFLCVEIQAAGTTGSPYPYVRELLNHGHYSGAVHTYGINWANEFSKTMMQQAYKKGKIVEYWHRKIVFIVQNVVLDYLEATSDCSGLEKSNPEMPIDFCTFSMKWNCKWTLSFDRVLSTTIDGVNRIIGGAKVTEYPSEKDFIKNIIRKGLSDNVLTLNSMLKNQLQGI